MFRGPWFHEPRGGEYVSSISVVVRLEISSSSSYSKFLKAFVRRYLQYTLESHLHFPAVSDIRKVDQIAISQSLFISPKDSSMP